MHGDTGPEPATLGMISHEIEFLFFKYLLLFCQMYDQHYFRSYYLFMNIYLVMENLNRDQL